MLLVTQALRYGQKKVNRCGYDHCTHTGGGAIGKRLNAPPGGPISRLKAVLRGLAAASLTVLPLTISTPALAADTLSLTEAIAALPVADESRAGHDRDAFRHWNSGANPSDGCNTRAEVLIAEAVEPPTVGPKCRLTGGRWWS